MLRRLRAHLLLLALGGSGCIGVIGSSDEDDPGGTAVSDAEALGVDDTRRLSPETYIQSLRTLFGDSTVDQAQGLLPLLPNDRADNEFSTMERGITSGHVEAYFALGRSVANAVSLDPAVRGELDPCLAASSPDDACVAGALRNLGRRAYRRPLDDAELDALMSVFVEGRDALAFEDGFALALMTVLQSPPFLYQLELGQGQGPTVQVELTGYELAARLALFLTGAPPDDQLLDLAGTGGLDDPDTYSAEVQRLLNTAAARDMHKRFVEQWLHLARIPVPAQSPAFLQGLDPLATQQEMKDELATLAVHHVFDAASDYPTWITSDLTYAGANLSTVYGTSAAETPVSTPDRAGLLTRAGVLAHPGENTQPILRAAWVLKDLLCDDIELPPPSSEVVVEPPPFDPDKTARERWTDQTSGGVCGACHDRLNPFGFALEGYDSLGRARELEPIIDPNDGTALNDLPIDARVTVDLDGAPITVDGASELSQAVADSARAQACFARKWFRFSFGRRETPIEVEAMIEAAQRPGTSLRDVLAALAESPNFRIRTLPSEGL